MSNNRFKFRAWHKEAMEMLTDDFSGEVFKWLRDRQPLEVMQFTGLTDKHEKDVYEGDIVQAYQMGRKCDELFVIKYLGRSFTMEGPHDVDNTHGLDNIWYFDFEVIGNIYENQNLIEEL